MGVFTNTNEWAVFVFDLSCCNVIVGSLERGVKIKIIFGRTVVQFSVVA
jgi:hypothetical protein